MTYALRGATLPGVNYFFTSDLHLWHRKIMLLSGRPFTSTDEHNAAIQDNINQDVGPSDTLVILGDVAFGSARRLAEWIDGLRCKNLCLCYGNHDDTVKTLVKREPKRFHRVGDVLEFKIPVPCTDDGKAINIFCSHYAHRVWNKSHHGSLHLYGHSHGSLPDDPNARSMDVGVDTNGYRPWSLDAIRANLAKRRFNPVDHHKDISGVPNTAFCALCGYEKGRHQKETLLCPIDNSLGFHETQYFAPKPDEPWLRRVLDDAKKAHDKLPDWAKSGS